MARKRQVLQIITSNQRRGAEQFAVGLEHELTTRGFDVETLALRHAEGGLDVETLGEGIDLKTLTRLRREIQNSEVVIAHGSVTLPMCSVASLWTGVPFIYRNIGDPLFWGSTRRRRTQSRLFLSRAAWVVALATQTRERVHSIYKVPLDRISVIPRGVSADAFGTPTPDARDTARDCFGIRRDARVVLFLGSLTEEKNVHAAVLMMEHLPDWQLLVVGDGPDRDSAARLANNTAPGRVTFAGTTDSPAAAHAAADVLVVPSLTEGLPGVAIEAAMMGTPCVVTDVGFVREIVDDHASGRVVATAEPHGLAAAVADCFANRGTMGPLARRNAVEHFSMSSVADRWAVVLSSVIATGSDTHVDRVPG